MKDLTRRLISFTFFERTQMEKYLERMAQKGWMLEHMGDYVWTFRRAEPNTVQYSVSYAHRASAFDPDLTEEQRDFANYCARTGWGLCASNAQIQVFCNAREDAVPIYTDPALELENLHRAAKRRMIPACSLLLALLLWRAWLFAADLIRGPISVLVSSLRLLYGVLLLAMILITAGELLVYFLWRVRALKAAERGVLLPTPAFSMFQKIVLLAVAAVCVGIFFFGNPILRTVYLLILLSGAMLLFCFIGIKAFFKRIGMPRGESRIFTMILLLALILLLLFGLIRLLESGILPLQG